MTISNAEPVEYYALESETLEEAIGLLIMEQAVARYGANGEEAELPWTVFA